MEDYSWVTDVDFDGKLCEIVQQMSVADLMIIPGMYELLKEELNNEVLRALEEERDDKEEEE